MRVKIFFLLWAFLLSPLSLFASGDKEMQKELNKCSKINCSDLSGDAQVQCSKSKGLCFRQAFKKRVAMWKELGISSKDKKKVLASLDQTRAKNEALYKKLKEETLYIKKVLDEVITMQKEVKSLHPTK